MNMDVTSQVMAVHKVSGKQLTDDMDFRLRVSEKRREDLEQENAELREVADRNEFDRGDFREQLFSLLEATDRR